MVCTTMIFAKTYLSDRLYFNYPENFLLTQSESGEGETAVVQLPEKEAMVIYMLLSDSSFFNAGEPGLEPLFAQVGKPKALEYAQSVRLSDVQFGVPQNVRFPHLQGLLSVLETENDEGVKYAGSMIMSVKRTDLLIIMSLVSGKDYDPVIYKMLRSTRMGKADLDELLSATGSQQMPLDPFDGNDSVFIKVDRMPMFPGGQKALFVYLSENVKYPDQAAVLGKEGRVICQFVVNRDGSISDVEVVRSGGYKPLDNEAIRVISNMPQWTPGVKDGKPVRVRYTVPVNFRLE